MSEESSRSITPGGFDAIDSVRLLGQVANRFASQSIFDDYRERRSANTLKRHAADLAIFAEFLKVAGAIIDPEQLQVSPEAWRGITWGIVAAFKRWLLQQGYAINTVNARLSTVRIYTGLAYQAGIIDHEEYTRIQQVAGYSHKEAGHVDKKRETSRVGDKKAESVRISTDQAAALKNQPLDQPQGRRDAVIMTLLLDHGLRAGELAALAVNNVDLDTLELRFNRPKVAKVQIHRLEPDTIRALTRWVQSGDAPEEGPLLRSSRKGGILTTPGMTVRAIRKRVRYLGEEIGLKNLSPHDCRHFWATLAVRSGTDPFSLKQAGGWNSMATVARYVGDADVANEGVLLAGSRIRQPRTEIPKE